MRPISVQKNIPIPRKRRAGRMYRYPLVELKVGDSFLVRGGEVRTVSSMVCTRCRYMNGDGGHRKFTVRTVPQGVRVWRVK